MPRPKQDQPTPGELEILKILWDNGPCSVRDVMNLMNEERPRAYTSVMSLLNVMYEKGLLTREPDGRAFVYKAKAARDKTLGRMVNDLLGRAFAGSASALVSQVLDQSNPTHAELDEIRKAIDEYQQQGDE